MKLYNLNQKGELAPTNKLSFSENEAYIVDDEKTLYIWVGENLPLDKQDKAVKLARGLNAKRDGAAKLLLMNQNKEYGAFLPLMAQLRTGIKEGENIERRPELELQEPKTVKEVKKTEDDGALIGWLQQYVAIRAGAPSKTESIIKETSKEVEVEVEPEIEELSFEEQVNVAAYFLSQNQLTYNDLCWLLAEKNLILQKGYDNFTEADIKKKAEEVFATSCTYDELCWLVAELELIMKKGYMDEFL